MKSKKTKVVAIVAAIVAAVVGIILCIPTITVNVHKYVSPEK